MEVKAWKHVCSTSGVFTLIVAPKSQNATLFINVPFTLIATVRAILENGNAKVIVKPILSEKHKFIVTLSAHGFPVINCTNCSSTYAFVEDDVKIRDDAETRAICELKLQNDKLNTQLTNLWILYNQLQLTVDNLPAVGDIPQHTMYQLNNANKHVHAALTNKRKEPSYAEYAQMQQLRMQQMHLQQLHDFEDYTDNL